jgi:hypothetical protein
VIRVVPMTVAHAAEVLRIFQAGINTGAKPSEARTLRLPNYGVASSAYCAAARCRVSASSPLYVPAT